MSNLNLSAEPRTVFGRKTNQLRRQGWVPVVVYGTVAEPLSLQVTARDLERTLHAGGASQVVTLSVTGGGVHNILIKEVQREPVSHALLHADFYAVNMNEKQRVAVPVVAVGKPSGMAAGLMLFQAHEIVHIEALPADIPAEIEVDVTPLTLEHPIHVRDLPPIQGVTYLDDPDEVIFSLMMTRAAEAELAEAEAVAGAEPEVVKKGKQTEEESEE
ncbi:50S ribosomal protein L25 [Caldilinea sp.]|jgi:large subunit ribosomal protein L25|uniref:50S ribosomal protein L25 n=1 Tax=Caldilinea sp. TaxID=2293560 RepID=UPI0021DEFF6A|nr:50S ribosomal protein L25 [Caldilinea sp.]GIV69927.1 MAG: 50S ribosomal protein L25 [Caldilinea sp.]